MAQAAALVVIIVLVAVVIIVVVGGNRGGRGGGGGGGARRLVGVCVILDGIIGCDVNGLHSGNGGKVGLLRFLICMCWGGVGLYRCHTGYGTDNKHQSALRKLECCFISPPHQTANQ